MSQKNFSSAQFNLSGIGGWVVLLAIAWLLGTIGLGWLVKSVLVLIGLLVFTPVIAFFAIRWWLKRNVVQDQCPVCGVSSAGINGTQLLCPSCSEPLRVDQGHFYRITPPGTVDVEAVEVIAQQIED